MSFAKKVFVYFVLFIIVIFAIFACIFFYGFKTDYIDLVQITSSQNDIDKSLIFAVIKAESKFNAKAQSKKGAIGLMQMLPSTANFVLQNYVKNDLTEFDINYNNVSNYGNAEVHNVNTNNNKPNIISNKIITLAIKGQVEKTDLFNPEINIFLGSKYLKYLIDKFKNVHIMLVKQMLGLG